MRYPLTSMALGIMLLLLASLPLEADEEQKKRFAELEKTLNNVKLVGNFTVVGEAADKGLTKEEYTITKVEKQKEGDYWRIHARIKYSGQDVELPLDLIAAVPGTYTGPASRAYLYYGDEHKHWSDPLSIEIAPRQG